MKKLLVLLLGMAVMTATAGITKSPLQKKISDSPKAKTEFVTPFKMNRVLDKQVLRAPVTEQPEGEVRTYQRSGDCLYIDGQYVTAGTQDGFVTLIFADNNIVWFKNIFYMVGENYGDSYVYGTLSADGTKITVPMGQSIYYSDYYSADVVLSFGTSSVGSNIVWTPDESVTEVVYAIDGNTITLEGCGGAAPSGSSYPEYEYNGLGSVWTDDGSFGGFLEWETVFNFVLIPGVPVVTVEPAATTAYVDWAADENSDGYNLRWRPWTDLSGNPHEWTFPVATLDDEIEGWWAYDADGDGQGWGFAYTDDGQTDACLISGSYTSSGACSPDNYIGTPDVPLKGELHFTMWGRSASYPEVVQVYALVGDALYQLFEDSLVTTTTHTVYTVDLSVFEGVEGSIVFRNYSTYNQWSVYIDDIFVGDPNAEIIEPAEWTYVNGLTDTEYTIEGLTPGTKYEVQVQGYNHDFTGDWCDIVEFTTLYNVYMLGGNDQGWDPTQGTLFTYDAENDVYTLNYTFPAEYNYFGFTTELAENNDDGGWAYIEPFRFGAIADEGTDYWYTGEEDYISLTWDAYHAIRIPAGEYNMTLDLNEMKLYIEAVSAPAGLRGDVNKDGDVTIGDVTALINALLADVYDEADHFSPNNADCNLDETITIGDVTALINYLLSGNW